ncbi:uncharacterized protein LOC122064324 isoform X1 [Macadamia integrifolia]|uniref:uncharacterized protein LOC122064324 isoform X1 n=1 Tax=Macadamia integrifolia TaxID=60698 RepID=UPI001C4FF9B6|nr:uncharacterized protein LOC122064324 isoform X1 [Macadamia integrifolia]XP_042483964.1 uncharacterized protein LOC122064324 isoform X1 [Macadamia integrifolia]
MGPVEPYWRTSTSFSPPLSGRRDYRYATRDAVRLYGSSLSSNSKKSRGQGRGDHLPHHQHSASDGYGSYFSCPSDSFQTPQGTSPSRQGVNIDDYVSAVMRESVSEPLSFTPSMEGTSAIHYSAGSSSSRSDGSEYEPIAKMHTSSNHNFSIRRLFMSKPIHPVSFPNQIERFSTGNSIDLSDHSENKGTQHLDPKSIQNFAELQTVSGVLEFDATTPHTEIQRWSSASSSIDFTGVSEHLDSENITPLCNLTDSSRCGLCDRFLSQKSPWSSRRIVMGGDMPVTGVLSCCHVFHADCLEQTTPMTHKLDPPCPLCVRSEEIVGEHRAFPRLRNGFPRLRPFCGEGPSRPCGCGQVGDCAEALHAPPHNTLVLLNQSRLKKHFFLKSNSSKEVPDKLKKIMPHSSHILDRISVDHGAGGCSKIMAESAMKRC